MILATKFHSVAVGIWALGSENGHKLFRPSFDGKQ